MPTSEFWWFLLALSLQLIFLPRVSAGVFFSSSSEQIVWKKKRKTAFFCSKSVDYLYIGVCVFSVEFDQVENKKTVDEIEFSPIFFFFVRWKIK